MSLRFTKMHGIGNDYVYLDLFEERVSDPASLARRISDRHTGIGADGLILIAPPADPANDCRMEMYNADGSRAEMCGNGIRCVGRYVYERGIAQRDELRVETDDGVKELRLRLSSGGAVDGVTVDMGKPRLRRREVPLADGADPEEPAVDLTVEAAGQRFRLTAVSMGNPHAVVFVDDARRDDPPRELRLETLPLETWGPALEHHAWFPERTNAEFVTARSRRELDLRVWERGSGETLACGTGACAAVVAGVLTGRSERRARVRLRGGDLEVEWLEEERGGSVLLTGPATEVFRGEWVGKSVPAADRRATRQPRCSPKE